MTSVERVSSSAGRICEDFSTGAADTYYQLTSAIRTKNVLPVRQSYLTRLLKIPLSKKQIHIYVLSDVHAFNHIIAEVDIFVVASRATGIFLGNLNM